VVNAAGLTSSSGNLKAGTHTGIASVSSTLGGADAANYSFVGATADYIVSKLVLTTTGATASNKVYDATTSATISGETLAGVLLTDAVTVSGAGTFADKNVANRRSVTAALLLAGTDSGNYTLVQPTGLTANITPATLTTTGAVASNKTYDATTAATISGEVLSGVLLTDTVTASGAGTFADKNVANGKPVTAALILAGTDSANYILTQPVGLTANITVRPLSIWTASADGLWSNPANWDVLPDGQNVLAVSIPTGGNYQVTYDGGTTTLQNLNSAQTIVMANGNLTIGSKLYTTAIQQTV
jgi:hypothetical protein